MPMSAIDEDSKLDRRQAAQVLRRAFRMLKPYKRDVAGAGFLVTVSTLAVLAGPFLLKVGIDKGISEGDEATLDLAVAAFVVVAAVAYVASRIQVLMISRAGEGFLRDLRNRVFDHLLKLSMPFYDREKAGVVISRMTSDVDSLQELIQQGLLQLLASVLLIVGSVVFLGIVSWQLLLVCLIPVPFVVLASIKFQRDSNEAYLTVRDRIGLTLSSLQEGISGVRVIQAYGREDVEIGRFESRNNSLYRAHMKSVFVQAWYLPVIEGAAVGCTALVVAIGGRMAVSGAASVGTVAFFVLTLSNLFEPLQQLSQLFNTVQSSGAALQKLFDLLDTPVDLEERAGAVALADHGELRVEGLSFAYGSGPPVLSAVDLVLPEGEKLALVGPTGAGKSTLAKLMARLYDPTEGRVTFGGTDLRDAQLTSLRRKITVVPQEGYLFHGSIRDNVRIGRPDATDQEVSDALESLGLLARFASQAEGLDTEVNERGSSLSAGERQLVSLARAALADPAVLVLDEATSSLDPGTEVLVETALERLVRGRTVIVIAHRLTTAERSDRVGVVADGRLVELGTHADLVAQGGHYARLYRSWVHGLAASG
ncbi:MAG TPA: ABC transporter ATP-binding protein [Acidimicrobiales bacterium]|nr:ABC transporter ATP-binding protein [Acidimicrobiales bacterium]